MVIIYFASHGKAQQDRFYVIPYDIGLPDTLEQLDAAILKAILQHSISDLELEHAFEHIDAGHLIMIEQPLIARLPPNAHITIVL